MEEDITKFSQELIDEVLGGTSLSNVVDKVSKYVQFNINKSEKGKRICQETRTKDGLELMKIRKELKELNHYKDTTVGLWVTDRPELVYDENQVMWQLKD